MEHLTINSSGRARREKLHGREFLVVPLTMIVPGVLNGSQGSLFYPPSEISRNFQAWNGIPLTVGHPSRNGQQLSGRDPSVLNETGIGYVFHVRTDGGKLKGEGWFDVDVVRKVDNRIHDALVNGRKMELSTGLFTDNHPASPGSTYNGKPYTHIARNYRPDHLAILPDQVGACSVNDGCGLNVNAFCPTGPGGGRDNSCSSRDGSSKGVDALKDRVKEKFGRSLKNGHNNINGMSFFVDLEEDRGPAADSLEIFPARKEHQSLYQKAFESKGFMTESTGDNMGSFRIHFPEKSTASKNGDENWRKKMSSSQLEELETLKDEFNRAAARASRDMASMRDQDLAEAVGQKLMKAYTKFNVHVYDRIAGFEPEGYPFFEGTKNSSEEEDCHCGGTCDECQAELEDEYEEEEREPVDTVTNAKEVIWREMGKILGVIPTTDNAFCPTGEGGGVDPTCSPKGARGSSGGKAGAGSGGRDVTIPTKDVKVGYQFKMDDGTTETILGIVTGKSVGSSAPRVAYTDGKVGKFGVPLYEDRGQMAVVTIPTTDNAFCPTGVGGGVDPTCSPKGAGAGLTPDQRAEATTKWLTSSDGKAALAEKNRRIGEMNTLLSEARELGNTAEAREHQREIMKLKGKPPSDFSDGSLEKALGNYEAFHTQAKSEQIGRVAKDIAKGHMDAAGGNVTKAIRSAKQSVGKMTPTNAHRWHHDKALQFLSSLEQQSTDNAVTEGRWVTIGGVHVFLKDSPNYPSSKSVRASKPTKTSKKSGGTSKGKAKGPIKSKGVPGTITDMTTVGGLPGGMQFGNPKPTDQDQFYRSDSKVSEFLEAATKLGYDVSYDDRSLSNSRTWVRVHGVNTPEEHKKLKDLGERYGRDVPIWEKPAAKALVPETTDSFEFLKERETPEQAARLQKLKEFTAAKYKSKPTDNAFCPTGAGGGKDNSCSSKDGSGTGGSNIRKKVYKGAHFDTKERDKAAQDEGYRDHKDKIESEAVFRKPGPSGGSKLEQEMADLKRRSDKTKADKEQLDRQREESRPTPQKIMQAVGKHMKTSFLRDRVALRKVGRVADKLGHKFFGKKDWTAIKGVPGDIKARFKNLFKKGKFTSNSGYDEELVYVNPFTLNFLVRNGFVVDDTNEDYGTAVVPDYSAVSTN